MKLPGKNFVLVFSVIAFASFLKLACAGTDPPPKPCEAPSTCADWDAELCECRDVVEPPPACEPPTGCAAWDEETCLCLDVASKSCATPIDERLNEDYIPLLRTDHWQRELRVMDQRLIHNGIRNPAFALRNCGADTPNTVWPYNGITDIEAGNTIDLSTEAKQALTGDDGESGFYQRVAQQHPTRTEGRSRVYRPCFTEYWRLGRWLTDGCANPEGGELAECTAFNPGSQPTGPVSRLDGVKGACQAMLDK